MTAGESAAPSRKNADAQDLDITSPAGRERWLNGKVAEIQASLDSNNIPAALYIIYKFFRVNFVGRDDRSNMLRDLFESSEKKVDLIKLYLEETNNCSGPSDLDRFSQMIFASVALTWNFSGFNLRGDPSFEIKIQKLFKKYSLILKPLLNTLDPAPTEVGKKHERIRIAHIVPQIVDEVHSPTKVVDMFLRHHDQEKFEPYLFVTDGNYYTKYLLNSQMSKHSLESGPQFLERATKTHRVKKRYTGMKMSCSEKLVALCHQIREDEIDVLLFHGNMAWAVDAILSLMLPEKFQASYDLGAPLLNECIQVSIHPTTSASDVYAELLELYDIEHRILSQPILDQGDLSSIIPATVPGFSRSNIVAVTAGNHLGERMSDAFLSVVIRALKKYGHLRYLVLGGREHARAEQRFSECGVLNQVYFAGQVANVMAYLKSCDIYLNEFPLGGGSTVAEAMACGLPVVAMRCGDGHLESFASECIGEDHAILSYDPEKYFARLDELIANENARRDLSQVMKKRYQHCAVDNGITHQVEKILLERAGYRKKPTPKPEHRRIDEIFELLYVEGEATPAMFIRAINTLLLMGKPKYTKILLMDLLQCTRAAGKMEDYLQVYQWFCALDAEYFSNALGSDLSDILKHQVTMEVFTPLLRADLKLSALPARASPSVRIGHVIPCITDEEGSRFVILNGILKAYGDHLGEKHVDPYIILTDSENWSKPLARRMKLSTTPDGLLRKLKARWPGRVFWTQADLYSLSDRIRQMVGFIQDNHLDALVFHGETRHGVDHLLAELGVVNRQIGLSFGRTMCSPKISLALDINNRESLATREAWQAFGVRSESVALTGYTQLVAAILGEAGK